MGETALRLRTTEGPYVVIGDEVRRGRKVVGRIVASVEDRTTIDGKFTSDGEIKTKGVPRGAKRFSGELKPGTHYVIEDQDSGVHLVLAYATGVEPRYH